MPGSDQLRWVDLLNRDLAAIPNWQGCKTGRRGDQSSLRPRLSQHANIICLDPAQRTRCTEVEEVVYSACIDSKASFLASIGILRTLTLIPNFDGTSTVQTQTVINSAF